MRDLILIKLGGSVITNKKLVKTPRREMILRLSKEIFSARKQIGNNTLLIIATGGGSYSHPVAAKYEVQKGFINSRSLEGFVLTADAEVQINQIVMQYLLMAHIPAISFGPRSFALGEKAKIKSVFTESIREALNKGVVPVVYGDMLVDGSRGCMAFSGEQVMALIAKSLRRSFGKIAIINCSRTDGVYDDKGKTIPFIDRNNFNAVKDFITGSDGVDVTGGMIHKVKESLSLAEKYKISTLIINGNTKDNLLKAILGKEIKSTLIKAN